MNVKSGVIQVDGVEFRWSVLREQTWVTKVGSLGLAILIESEQEGRRNLVLQFDGEVGHRLTPKHQRFKIPDRRLIECVRNAIGAGWDPDSRGKKFTFAAGPASPS